MQARKCVVSRAVRDRSELIRFVLDPQDRVWPDIAEKAPGRGVWVTADAGTVRSAIKRKAFAAGFRQKVDVPEDLAEQVAARLSDQALHELGLAKRAGFVLVGEGAVRERLRVAEPALVLLAHDGAERTMARTFGMVKTIWGRETLVAGCFTAEELGTALGRPPCTHVFVSPSTIGDKLVLQLQRLSGFTPLVHAHWVKS